MCPKSALPPSISKGKGKKYTPAIGKYVFLNKIWRPVHRIAFLDPNMFKNEKELFRVVITSINVIDRPDLMRIPGASRKDSDEDKIAKRTKTHKVLMGMFSGRNFFLTYRTTY